MKFIYELLAVGFIRPILAFIISTLLLYNFSLNFNVNIKKYKFWWQVILSFFITGWLVHIICEYSGINKLHITKEKDEINRCYSSHNTPCNCGNKCVNKCVNKCF